MNSKTAKDAAFGSDSEKAKGAGGQQGSVLKGERAPQRNKIEYTEDDLRAIGEKARSRPLNQS